MYLSIPLFAKAFPQDYPLSRTLVQARSKTRALNSAASPLAADVYSSAGEENVATLSPAKGVALEKAMIPNMLKVADAPCEAHGGFEGPSFDRAALPPRVRAHGSSCHEFVKSKLDQLHDSIHHGALLARDVICPPAVFCVAAALRTSPAPRAQPFSS
jgi:hypothetical protein